MLCSCNADIVDLCLYHMKIIFFVFICLEKKLIDLPLIWGLPITVWVTIFLRKLVVNLSGIIPVEFESWRGGKR